MYQIVRLPKIDSLGHKNAMYRPNLGGALASIEAFNRNLWLRSRCFYYVQDINDPFMDWDEAETLFILEEYYKQGLLETE